MPSSTFYPALSTLIPFENIPKELGTFKNGLTNIFNKLYYRDLQIHKSALGDAAFYNLKIVTYKRIALEIGGANGLSLLLNPSLDENITGAISEFNVSLSYKWEILKYVKDFDLQSFDYSGAAIFNLILDFTGLNKQELLSEVIFLFIEDPDPIQKFVDDFNANGAYNITTPLIPIADPDSQIVIADLIIQLNTNGNSYDVNEIIFTSFLSDADSFGDVFNKIEILFQKWLGAFTIQDLKNLLVPQATTTLNLNFGIEFPISILRQVNALGQALLDPLTQKDIPALLVCSGGSFSFNSKNGFLFQPDYALSFINYAEIKGTGLYFTFTNAKIDLSRTSNIEEAMLDGRPLDFIGVYIQDAVIKFPAFWNHDSTNSTAQIIGRNLLIGTGGISGVLSLETATNGKALFKLGNPSAPDKNFELGLSNFLIEFKQNTIVRSEIGGTLKIPGFKDPNDNIAEIIVTAFIGTNGDFLITAAEKDGLLHLAIPEVLKLDLQKVGVGRVNDRWFLEASGRLSILAEIPKDSGKVFTINHKEIKHSNATVYSNNNIAA